MSSTTLMVITQSDICRGIAYWLNKEVLKNPVNVKQVKEAGSTRSSISGSSQTFEIEYEEVKELKEVCEASP